MASLARSGETLMLRSLSAHSKLVVPFNITDKVGSRSEELLYEYFSRYQPTEVDIHDPALKELGLTEESILIVKQGIWEHPHPFKGFVLIRNPVSVWASMLTYGINVKRTKAQLESHWAHHRISRFVAWAKAMNLDTGKSFMDSKPVDKFCKFYTNRVNQLINLGLPIIYYEDFVRRPEQNMMKICDALGIEFEAGMVNSHTKYSNGAVGHGFIALNRPIEESSIYKFKAILDQSDFDYIVANTPTPGYSMEWDSIRTIDGEA